MIITEHRALALHLSFHFQGPVTIEFTDETFLVGFGKKNRLVGIKRFFDAKSELANVTDAVTG